MIWFCASRACGLTTGADCTAAALVVWELLLDLVWSRLPLTGELCWSACWLAAYCCLSVWLALYTSLTVFLAVTLLTGCTAGFVLSTTGWCFIVWSPFIGWLILLVLLILLVSFSLSMLFTWFVSSAVPLGALTVDCGADWYLLSLTCSAVNATFCFCVACVVAELFVVCWIKYLHPFHIVYTL